MADGRSHPAAGAIPPVPDGDPDPQSYRSALAERFRERTSGLTSQLGGPSQPAPKRVKRGPDRKPRKPRARAGEPLAASTLKRGNHRVKSDRPAPAHLTSAVADQPFGPIDNTDRTRLALRDVQRKIRRVEGPPTDLVTLPGVQSLSAMTRFIDGGRDRFIEILQMAVLNNEPAAVKWWSVYRELPAFERSRVSFDDVCAASDVKPKDLVVIVISTAYDYHQDVGNLIAAITSPKIVDALTRSAERIDGDYAEVAMKDRHEFLRARGFLPVPKGTSIHVHASANAQAAAAASTEPTVPKFSDDLSAVGQRVSLVAPTPAFLADAPPAPLPAFAAIPAELIAPDDDQAG